MRNRRTPQPDPSPDSNNSFDWMTDMRGTPLSPSPLTRGVTQGGAAGGGEELMRLQSFRSSPSINQGLPHTASFILAAQPPRAPFAEEEPTTPLAATRSQHDF